jgi:TP901 family phage tail tape measure protein
VANMIADLFVRLSAMTAPYTEAMISASAQGEAFAEANDAMAESVEASNSEAAGSYGLIGKAMAALAVGFVAVSATSIEWATQFQTAMTRLYTQTGLTTSEMAAAGYTTSSLQAKVLSLGTQTGYSGTQMAQALYYPLSASFGLSTALDIVSQAAKGAQISGASLTDTTDALSAVMRSLYSDTSNQSLATANASTVMAQLNAIVGQGKMTFQDLDSSVKNWAPAASTFGVSLSSVGAALDFMVDRGDSATTAGTRVAMVMSMMAGQTEQAASFMKDLGLSQSDSLAATTAMSTALSDSGLSVSRLADDMKKPDGIFVALTDLHTAMDKNGVSAEAQSAILEKMFGGSRSFRGAAELYDNLSGIQQKFEAINAQSNQATWAEAWSQTTSTLRFRLDQLGAGVKNAGIAFGMFLIPKVTEAIGWLEKLGSSKVMPVVHSLGSVFQQIGAGFDGQNGTGGTSSGTDTPGTPSSPSGSASAGPWAQVGQTFRQVDTDFVRFVTDVAQAVPKLLDAFKGTAAFAGGVFLGALKTLAQVLADVVGPAILGFANFLDQHKAIVTFFADVVIGGLIARLLVLKTIDAATGLVNLANTIVSFPFSRVSEIGGAFTKLKQAWGGVDSVDGEGTVGGLKNSLGYLKQQISTFAGSAKDTLSGIWSGFKESDLVSSVGGAFKGAAQAARQQWSVMTGMASQAASRMGEALTGLPDKIGSAVWTGAFKAEQAFNGMKGWAFNAASNIQQYMGELPGKLSGAIDDLGARISVGMQQASDIAGNVADGISRKWSLAWSYVSGAVNDGMDFVESKIGSAAETIGGGLSKVASVGRTAWTAVTEGATTAATATWSFVTSTAAATASALRNAAGLVIDKTAEIATATASKAMAAAEWLLNAALLASPLTWIIVGVMAVIAVFVLLWTHCAAFRDFWKDLWKDITQLVGDAVSWVRSHLMLVAEILTGPLVGGILFLATHWRQVWGDIQSVALGAWHLLDNDVIHPIVSEFDWAQGEIGGFVRWWSGAWATVGHVLSALYNNTIRPIFNEIGSGIHGVTSAFSSVSSIASKVGSFLGFEDGGYVPGAPGSATLAIVHGGEYVLSRQMLTGQAPVDNRALTGILKTSGLGGGGGSMAGFAVGGGGVGGGNTTIIIPVTVLGSMLSTEQDIQNAVITVMNRFGLRNGATYVPYGRTRGS